MTWTTDPLPLDGPALRDQGMARAIQGATPWPELALDWVRSRQRGYLFTSEDLIAELGLPRVDVGKDSNNAVGAVVNAASRAGLIRRVDYVTAQRPNSHGAVIGLWVRS